MPFAIVRYADHGITQNDYLRLDLDKQIFLDHFEDEQREAVMRRAAPEIVDVVGEELYRGSHYKEA